MTLAAIFVIAVEANAMAQGEARWEYQGVASTGEKVYLNLDSIQADARGGGYFFTYQIGQDRPFSFTPCDGRFQVVKADGVTFEPMLEPQSEATRKMLRRVCTYHLSQ
ncbi:MAG: hypothetical protein KME07_06385 [Pegethrix bostrychoides GSE-TBD4-15B]|uniref:Uncharacterized protein n=1 Tax=Pegethrix bostrychoides GSE-TBD4-15B TaxID=2839662 RepID=A0A951P8S9_9CYAN|nr:hypothetical protein [Pegethrix bostrychoides GSE-TBD4-15B]